MFRYQCVTGDYFPFGKCSNMRGPDLHIVSTEYADALIYPKDHRKL